MHTFLSFLRGHFNIRFAFASKMSVASSNTSETFPIHEGTLLASCYKVQGLLGEGSFGKVLKCADIVTDTEVAIKIVKDKPHLIEQALEEIKILKQLQSLDPDKCNLVRWNGSFFHENLICLEFELLELNLHEYLQQRCYQPLSMREIRPVIYQLTTALLHLEALEIIHADIKPHNIMIVDRRLQPLHIKLIDFGLARFVSDAVPGSCVQSLWYRAPEVTLGQAFSEAIDMWSLGTVAAELGLGHPLFPAEQEYDLMKFIVDTLGQPPDYQLNDGKRSARFFHTEVACNQQTWRLKSPQEFARYGYHFRDTRFFPLSSLDDLVMMMYFRSKAREAKTELQNFVDLLKRMLLVDKSRRIIPLKVLAHPFFSVEWHSDSSHNMNIKNLTADMKEAELNVTQLPSPQRRSIIHGFELCNISSMSVTPCEEALLAAPGDVSAKLEDKAACVEPEVVVDTESTKLGCIKMFCNSIRKLMCCWFRSN